jgi:hypothetical protein
MLVPLFPVGFKAFCLYLLHAIFRLLYSLDGQRAKERRKENFFLNLPPIEQAERSYVRGITKTLGIPIPGVSP